MGLVRMFSGSSVGETPPQAPNPDPKRFKELRRYAGLNSAAVELVYEGCTTYEGRKILVFKGPSPLSHILTQPLGVDPHFSDSRAGAHPFARFEPTAIGWRTACRLVDSL